MVLKTQHQRKIMVANNAIIDADAESAKLAPKRACKPVVDADGLQVEKYDREHHSDEKQSPIIIAREKEE